MGGSVAGAVAHDLRSSGVVWRGGGVSQARVGVDGARSLYPMGADSGVSRSGPGGSRIGQPLLTSARA